MAQEVNMYNPPPQKQVTMVTLVTNYSKIKQNGLDEVTFKNPSSKINSFEGAGSNHG